MNDRFADLAETFKVLGDLTRVRMLDALSRGELCVGDLARRIGSTESAVSHQLRLLRSMRLVRPRRAGRLVFYRLDDDHIVRLFEQGLEHVLERGGNPRPVREERGGNPRPVREERGANPRPVREERGANPRPVREDRGTGASRGVRGRA